MTSLGNDVFVVIATGFSLSVREHTSSGRSEINDFVSPILTKQSSQIQNGGLTRGSIGGEKFGS